MAQILEVRNMREAATKERLRKVALRRQKECLDQPCSQLPKPLHPVFEQLIFDVHQIDSGNRLWRPHHCARARHAQADHRSAEPWPVEGHEDAGRVQIPLLDEPERIAGPRLALRRGVMAKNDFQSRS